MKRPIHYALVGIPDDWAVNAVGGRLGAKKGPAAFRQFFGKLAGEIPVAANVTDLGDVPELEARDSERHHERVTEFLRREVSRFDVLVVVGGAHDHGHSHLAGLASRYQKLGCINVDAHLDVRPASPKITSGSPFWLALERGILTPNRLVEFGVQDHCNGKSLWDYVAGKKVRTLRWCDLRRKPIGQVFHRELRSLATRCDGVVLSFDLDTIAASYAPGVSAPQAEGLSSRDAIEICEIAGAHPKVRSLGLFELNPDFDQDGRTARLAATMAWHFLAAKMKGLKGLK